MKKLFCFLASTFALLISARAVNYDSVMVNSTSGALGYPANFFQVNSNLYGALLFPGGSFNVPLTNSAGAFAGGGQFITNQMFIPPIRRITRPPVGVANWYDYYNVSGNTVNTGPEEPGEQILTNTFNFLRTNHIVENLWSNAWVRMDYGWANGFNNGNFIENSNKYPHGFTYDLGVGYSAAIKLWLDFSWELNTTFGQVGPAYRSILRWNPQGVGVLTDIAHSQNPASYRPRMEELRALINIADEARWSAHHFVQLTNGPQTNCPGLMFSANHLTTQTLWPAEMQAVDITYLIAGHSRYQTPASIAKQVGDSNIRSIPDWWTGIIHMNAGYPYGMFGSGAGATSDTNVYRIWLQAMAVTRAGFWQPMASGVNAYSSGAILNYWTNTAYHEFWSYVCGPNADQINRRPWIVSSNSDLQVWARPVGTAGATNLVMVWNIATNGTQTVNFNAGQLGVSSNVTFIVRDVMAGSNLGTMRGNYGQSVTQTNAMLLSVFPIGTYPLETTNAPSVGNSLKYDSITGMFYWN